MKRVTDWGTEDDDDDDVYIRRAGRSLYDTKEGSPCGHVHLRHAKKAQLDQFLPSFLRLHPFVSVSDERTEGERVCDGVMVESMEVRNAKSERVNCNLLTSDGFESSRTISQESN